MPTTPPRHDFQPIQTNYRGYRFRSRLEARWAVFLDQLGIKWDYEPEGFDLGEAGWYLPDFRLTDYDEWLEIKPDLSGEEQKAAIRRCRAFVLSQSQGAAITLFAGSFTTRATGSPLPHFGWRFRHGHTTRDSVVFREGVRFCRCPTCRRFSIKQLPHRGDMVVCGDCATEDWSDEKNALGQASLAAQQARFEHGETPVGPAR